MGKDTELVKKLKNPTLKDKAFSELLDEYQERLYWHIRKIVTTHENADDVLQNTFIRIYKSIQKFQEKSTLHTWMYRIAYNESIRFLEKNNKKSYTNIDAISESNLEVLFEDEYFDGDEIQKKLNTDVYLKKLASIEFNTILKTLEQQSEVLLLSLQEDQSSNIIKTIDTYLNFSFDYISHKRRNISTHADVLNSTNIFRNIINNYIRTLSILDHDIKLLKAIDFAKSFSLEFSKLKNQHLFFI